VKKELEKILPRVLKPSRYTGGEYNQIIKTEYNTRYCFCFPDVYEIGMSYLGLQILYRLINGIDGVWCERAFAPWIDMEKELKTNNILLFALESGDALCEFDIIGFTLQYEMSYTNILNMLSLGRVPMFSKDRKSLKNLVVAGGPCAMNPEPLADYIDAFILGDGEEVTVEFVNLYKKAQKENWSKDEFLMKATEIEGVYVPKFYIVEYNSDATVKSITATNGAPEKITKRIVENLDEMYCPDRFIVPNTEVVHDRACVELFRGCIRGCRFCQAGYATRPVRMKSPEVVARQGIELLKNTGYEEITMSSLSTSDYKGLEELCDTLLEYCTPKNINLSLPSLRADNFSFELQKKISCVRKVGLTFAPEAGSQRLRDVINKNITEHDLINTCSIAFSGGWNSIKLYFMMGLPTENFDDIKEIQMLTEKLFDAWRLNSRNKARNLKITVSVACFVPKPNTPFQWERQNSIEEFEKKQEYLNSILNKRVVSYHWHDSRTSVMEGIFARGDRRLSKVLYKAFELGCKFDGWDECFSFDKWMKAFDECDIDYRFYTDRVRDVSEILPWDILSTGVDKEFLIEERKKAYREETSPNCRQSCLACGASALLKGCGCDE